MSRPEFPPNGADEDALAYAVGRYALGGISIGKAAELADVDRWTMLEILQDTGITPRLGPKTIEDARREAAVALEENPDDYVAKFEDTDASDDNN